MNDYYNGFIETNENDLTHYGILGMKWGVRRYQNRDGTYTSLGNRRRSINYSEDYKVAHSGKDPRTMSTTELQKVNNRLNQERQYIQNTTPVKSQSQYSEGQKLVQQILKGTVTTTVSAIVGTTLVVKGRDIGKTIMESSTSKKLIIGGIAAAGAIGAGAYAYHQDNKDPNN